MSYDRKNKRAAQAALREAQAAGVDPSAVGTSPPSTGGDGWQASGLARSLQPSVDFGAGGGADQNEWHRAGAVASPPRSNGIGLSSPQSIGDTSLPSREPNGDVFGSFSSSEGGPIRPPPASQTFGSLSTSSAATPPASTAADHFLSPSSVQLPVHLNLAPTPTATFITPHAPSGLSQTLAQQFNGSNRSSVAAQVMLGQQARRLSSTSDSLSPPRLASQTRNPLSGAGVDLPNAIPASTSGGGNANAIFGTSPFSGGSRALFMPSSYDSNEDAFPRSPPSRNGLEDMRRSQSTGWPRVGGGEGDLALGLDGLDDDEGDDDGQGFYEEGFLPSSLNDLLTPEEQRRRASKMGLSSSLGGFDPFAGAKSVPAEMMLARGRPALVSSASAAAAPGAWGSLSASVEGTNPQAREYTPSPYSPPAPASRSLLSVGISAASSSPSYTTVSSSPSSASTSTLLTQSSHLLPRAPNSTGIYSSSFDARSLLHQHASPSGTSHFNTSHGAASHPLPLAAPSSLPGGLAAGLSQLHLVPAIHSGDTPPTNASSHLSSPARGGVWSAGGESPRTFAAAAAAGAARGAPAVRRMSSHQPPPPAAVGAGSGMASPLKQGAGGAGGAGSAGSEEGEEEEIQFSMDT